MKRTDRTLSTFDLRQPWVLSVLLIACIPVFPEYVAPFLSIFSLVIGMRDAKTHHRRVRVGEVGKALIAFLCFSVIQLIWATDRLASLVTIAGWIAMFCTYLTLTTVLTTSYRIETAMFMFFAVAGILGVVAAVQYVCVTLLDYDLTAYMLWYPVDRAVYSLFPVRVDMGAAETNRACATFTNPNLLAQYLVLTMPFSAAYGFSGKRSAAKILNRISLLLSVVGLIVTFSRGAYLAFGAIAVVMCIANVKRLVPILMVVFSMVPLLPKSVYERLSSLGDGADHAILERFELWGIAMQEFFKSPLAGQGPGIAVTFEAMQKAGFYNPHAHNLFLQILVEGGVVGLLLLLLILWKLFRVGFELVIHAPRRRMYGAAIIAFCAGFCMCGMVDYPLFTPKLIGVFVMMLGISDALGFTQIKRPAYTVWQALPFFNVIHDPLEEWVKKKTAPKEE